MSQPSAESVEKETQLLKSIQDASLREEKYVHTVYNEIATHFSQTRYKPWPIVEKFLKSRLKFSLGLDVGCGNGKYISVNPELFIIGSDRSSGLVECAKEFGHEVIVSDGLSLPHHDNFFDFAISIAVIHHFSTEERRIEAIRHILIKLKPTGEALIYCWALEQEKSRRGYKEGMEQDVLVPWVTKQATETKMRYYHLYKKGELVDNAQKAGATVVDNGYEKDNWWVIIRR